MERHASMPTGLRGILPVTAKTRIRKGKIPEEVHVLIILKKNTSKVMWLIGRIPTTVTHSTHPFQHQ